MMTQLPRRDTMVLAVVAMVMMAFAATVEGGGVTSKLQIQIPKSLTRDDGYEHREALFGDPPYGGSIEQNVYYADDEMCDANKDYRLGGFPTRDKDKNGVMKPMKTPYLMMVSRGGCTFVQKVRNAQRNGASAVIIADTKCLCSNSATCKPVDPTESCEPKEPIMADDGSGTDITIPSFLMFKEDADPVVKYLKENNAMVRMKMSWELPRPDDRVEYELWTTPSEVISRPIQRHFKEIAVKLGRHASFTPHMYIYDGINAGCQDADGQNQCYNLCTNNGRYCSTDPDDDLDRGISGADVVAESLRRTCIWKEYGSDGLGVEWWNYIEEFLFRCDSEKFFSNKSCIKDAMDHAQVASSKIEACMADSGGLEADGTNTMLEAELSARETSGVIILPTFYVNSAPLRGALIVSEVFEAICAGYAVGSDPDICKKCRTCSDVQTCIKDEHCPGEVGGLNTVSVPVFASTLLAVVVCFGCLGIIQWQRSQRQMRAQVRGIVAEYMPLDVNNKVESADYDDEDDNGLRAGEYS